MSERDERRSAFRLALDSLIARDILLPMPASAIFVLDFTLIIPESLNATNERS